MSAVVVERRFTWILIAAIGLTACDGGSAQQMTATPQPSPVVPSPAEVSTTSMPRPTTTPSSDVPSTPSVADTIAAEVGAASTAVTGSNGEDVPVIIVTSPAEGDSEGDRDAAASVEVTLEEFDTKIDDCFADPTGCDLEQILNTYTETGVSVAKELRSRFEALTAEKASIAPEMVEREIVEASVLTPPEFAMTVQCTIDRTDTPTIYRRDEYRWALSESDTWVIITSRSLTDPDPNQLDDCDFTAK